MPSPCGAIFVEARRGRNGKVGRVDQTYASIAATCRDCGLKDNGCYAQAGRVGLHARRLDAQCEGADSVAVASAEATAIDAAYRGGPVPGTDMRLHVSGDCPTPEGARILAGAVERWKARGGKCAWTYTHSWRRVLRDDWRPVSVLASLDDALAAPEAIAMGYAVARVVGEFPSGDKAWTEGGIRWVPCPEQTRGVRCVDCRLCFDSDKLRREGIGIAFKAHGSGPRRALTVVR